MATVISNREIEIGDIPPIDHSEILPRLQRRRELRQSEYTEAPEAKSKSVSIKSVLKYLAVFLLISGAVIAYTLTYTKQNNAVESLVVLASEGKQSNTNTYAIELEMGSKHAYQHCGNMIFKRSFPNIDYALFGYHILKGFPFANGHDPGFTYPIFAANFARGGLSADCRFFVPDGLVVNSDVSCFLSITSHTVQTQHEYSLLLETETKIEAEYGSVGKKVGKALQNSVPGKFKVSPWGLSFSASIGYKQSSSKLSSGSSVYIFSSAKCKYYYSKLVQENPPKFDKAFLKLIKNLDREDPDIQFYFQLFDTYGTHFVTEATFGARYTFEHKMSSNYYERLKGFGVDVNILADYVGKKRLAVDTSLSVENKNYVAEFLENVETTIIPVGAVPTESGGSLSWASEVQSNPIPTEYKLASIEDLFTDTYMENMPVNYQRIRGNIIGLKYRYCTFLKDAGEVESCANLGTGIILKNTRLTGHYKELADSSLSDCIEKCLQDVHCKATTYCVSCSSKDIEYRKCFLLKGLDNTISAIKTEKPDTIWQSNIFPVKMNTEIKLSNVSVIGPEIMNDNKDDEVEELARCKTLCIVEAHCTVYTFSNSSSSCKLYNKMSVTGLDSTVDMDTFFLPSHIDVTL